MMKKTSFVVLAVGVCISFSVFISLPVDAFVVGPTYCATADPSSQCRVGADDPEQTAVGKYGSALGMSKAAVESSIAKFNFGPASSRDHVLYTSERPGHGSGFDGKITEDDVQEWISYMKRIKGVNNVIVLLDPNELDAYSEPGLQRMLANAGMKYRVAAMASLGAASRIFDDIEAVEKRGERVVVHCTDGFGLAGRVAAGWLVSKYGLTPEDATAETVLQANQSGVRRKGDAKRLREWLRQPNLKP